MEQSHSGGWTLWGVRHPYWTVVLAALLMAGLAAGMGRVYKDTRADAFLSADNPALIYKNKVKEIFGLSDPLVIAIEDHRDGGIYQSDTLALVAGLTEAVNALKWVDEARTISLATEKNIRGNDEGMVVEPFLEVFERGGARALRAAIAEFPLYQGLLVSRDDAMTVIVVEFYQDSMAEPAYRAIAELVERFNDIDQLDIHVAGEGAVLGFLGHYIDRDASRLNPLAGLIITVMLVVAFRRLAPALIGNVVIAATVLMTVGFMAYCGVPFFVITNAMPVILIGMAVADSIHIFSHYYEAQLHHPEWTPRQCIAASVREMFRPVTLTTLTTMSGFLGLWASAYMPPFEYFGLFTAFGVAVAWLYSVFVLPAMIAIFQPRVSSGWLRLQQRQSADLFSRAMAQLGRLALYRPALTVTAFAALAIFGALQASQLRVNENRINTFHKSEAIYQADRAINRHLDGSNTLDIVVTTAQAEGVFVLPLLRRMESLQRYAESLPHVNGSASVVDYLKQMHKSLNEGRPEYYRLPESDALIPQYFLLYDTSADPSDFEEEVDYDYRLANIRLNLDTADFAATRPVIEALQQYIDAEFNSELGSAALSGRVNVNYHWIKDIGVSHFVGVGISLLCVLLVSALLFRSFVAGLLAVAPVLCSILTVYAAMAVLNIDLGIGTSMFASVAIGLGIDFAIHTLDRIKSLYQDGYQDLGELFSALLGSTGRALLFNYLAIAFGFGVLISSKVVPLTNFGTIVVLSVTISFVAAMTLLPALVWLLRPRFLFGAADAKCPGLSAKATLTPLLLAATLAVAGLYAPRLIAEEALPAGDWVVAQINAVDDGEQQTSQLHMLLRDRRGKERQREALSYRRYFGEDKKTVFFYRSPANVRDTAFLTYDYRDAALDDDQWLYLPALRKVRRISAADRGDYFMGTDLSYEDIKQNGRFDLGDYHFRSIGRGEWEIDGQRRPMLEVEALPRSAEIAQELGYGRLHFKVDSERWIVTDIEFWDPKGRQLKSYRARDIRRVDGIWTRHRVEIQHHINGHYTAFTFSDVDYQSPVPERLFTTSSLRRGL